MANRSQIQNVSRLIDKKVDQIFMTIQKEKDIGSIRNQTEYLYRLYQGLREFYENFGKPTMKVRYAKSTPSSREYNQTIQEIHQDIQTVYTETEVINETLENSFYQIETERQHLQYRIQHIEEKMTRIDKKMEESVNESIYQETFIDQSQYDIDMIQDHPAHVWTREGVLTLAPRLSEDYLSNATVRIISGNGLPGNTKQARSVSGELKFIGEESLHLNLADILDGNSDTWYEYETFKVGADVLSKTDNLGFEYEEGVRWTIEDSESLTFIMEIELAKIEIVNWFSINPFIPNEKGAVPAYIDLIEIDNGKGNVYKPIQNPDIFREEKVYLFGRQPCKKIRIKFRQPSGYDTTIGHLYYKEIEKNEVNYLERVKNEEGKRIEGKWPSVESLNVRYDPQTQGLVYKDVQTGDEIQNLSAIQESLFNTPNAHELSSYVQAGFEQLPASRYSVGIRDIGLSNYQFESSSEYISKPFVSSKEIIGVSLYSDHEIPVEFGEGDWIQYFISPNNGQNWYRIEPRGITKANTKIMYWFNTNTPNEARLDMFGYIDNINAVEQIRVRAVLTRPESLSDSMYYTPILHGYELKVITKGDL